uniref:Carboxypeptidase n=1 Tax=Caenorhabditis japonica TaxID=281687 RepID=A0A8R1HJH7_CAEJA
MHAKFIVRLERVISVLYRVNTDGATLSVNPYSWNKNASILTLEAPAGVGYSYATDNDIATGDDNTANENWQALVAFFTEFPQYKQNDFYVTGESYGGIYVPTLVQTILDRQSQFNINIKGLAIGNGCVSEQEGTDSLVNFLYAHGVVDQAKWDHVKTSCCHNDTDSCPWSTFSDFTTCGQFVLATQETAWNGGLNPYNMYADCVSTSASSRFSLEYERRFNKKYQPSELGVVPCLDESPVTDYLNRQDVRKALGIPSSLPQWSICNNAISYGYKRQYGDMTSRILNAVNNNNLKMMLYNGDVDLACNALMGQRFTDKLGLTLHKKKSHFYVNNQVGGYVTTYKDGKVAFTTVRGAGHMVPTDKPAVADHIIQSFLFNKSF